jgi:flagellar hook-length control protein FliK
MNRISGDIVSIQSSDVESSVIRAGSESQHEACEQAQFCLGQLQSLTQQEFHERDTLDDQLLQPEDLSALVSAYEQDQQYLEYETISNLPLLAGSPDYSSEHETLGLDSGPIVRENNLNILARLGVYEAAGNANSPTNTFETARNYTSVPSASASAAEMTGQRQQLSDLDAVNQLFSQVKQDGSAAAPMIPQARSDNHTLIAANDVEHSSLASVTDSSRLKNAGDTPSQLSPMTAITPAVSTQTTTAGYEWRSPALDVREVGLGKKLTSILGDKIHLQMGHSIQRANIRLDPPNLGLIEIQIITEGDRTKVQLFSANAFVRDVMLQNIDQLRSQLAQKLGMDTSVEVGSESPGERDQKQAMEQAHTIIAGEFEEGEMLVQLKQQSGWINRLI